MSAALLMRSTLSLARRWPLIVLLLLVPLWSVGTFYRGSWTPDEPREADIVWHMANQQDRTLPNFAGAPFLEKPPLYYWVAARAHALLGESVQASRAPNLLYAAITVLALGTLAFSMAGTEAALLSALIAGSTLVLLRVSIWLAPDAGLIAGCSVALLGAYLGYVSRPGGTKLLAYTVMHAAAAVGFMAKSAPGWIVPAVALLVLIAWERRWSELRRPELYAGLVIQAVIIGPWLVSVWNAPDGRHALRVLFYDNLAGRVGTVTSADGTAYSSGHPNWAGRYLLELPFSLLPWTFLLVAAARSAWTRFRNGTLNTAWRFAIAAWLPLVLLLSAASTARDIYAAPAVLGIALLITLWALDLGPEPGRLAQFSLKATRILIVVINCVLAGSAIIIAAANGYDAVGLLVIPTLIGPLSVLGLRAARFRAERGEYVGSIVACAAAFVIALFLTSLSIFPAVDRWQDLPAIGRAIHRDTEGKTLALLEPDETTLAMLDDSLRELPVSIRGPEAVPAWFCAHGSDARLLVMLPGHAPGEISRLLVTVMRQKSPGDGIATTLEQRGVAKLLRRYELPHGRRYAVMEPGSVPCDRSGPTVDRS